MGLHFRSGWSRAGRCSVSDVQSFRPLGKLKSGGREDLPYRLSSAGVDRFFKEILGRTYQTEVATGYQKRFGKNRDRLFTFLDHDGIPWNNNNDDSPTALPPPADAISKRNWQASIRSSRLG